MLKINKEQKIIDLNISGNLDLEKNLVLATHMVRSEKHFDIFKVLETIKVKSADELKDRFDFDLTGRFDEVRLVVYGFSTFVDLFVTENYIRRDNMFFIPIRVGVKINYIKLIIENDDEVSNASLVTVKIPSSFRVCGRIDKTVTAMVQSSKDHGKISFKTIR